MSASVYTSSMFSVYTSLSIMKICICIVVGSSAADQPDVSPCFYSFAILVFVKGLFLVLKQVRFVCLSGAAPHITQGVAFISAQWGFYLPKKYTLGM